MDIDTVAMFLILESILLHQCEQASSELPPELHHQWLAQPNHRVANVGQTVESARLGGPKLDMMHGVRMDSKTIYKFV